MLASPAWIATIRRQASLLRHAPSGRLWSRDVPVHDQVLIHLAYGTASTACRLFGVRLPFRDLREQAGDTFSQMSRRPSTPLSWARVATSMKSGRSRGTTLVAANNADWSGWSWDRVRVLALPRAAMIGCRGRCFARRWPGISAFYRTARSPSVPATAATLIQQGRPARLNPVEGAAHAPPEAVAGRCG